jgi:antitoxin component YwqK of YwqJK toxin-antitoxin module
MAEQEGIRFYPRFVVFHRPVILQRVTEGQLRVYICDGREVAWETLDPGGHVTRIDGAIPDGTVREYYDTGELKAELEYRSGALNGAVREFLRNGDLASQTGYQDGGMHGERRVFSQTGEGVIVETASYAHDRLHGARTVTFDNGKPWCEETYSDGLLQGEKRLYFKNGQMKVCEHYSAGRLNGQRVAYHDNGRVQCEEEYADGKLVSRKMYMRNGQPIESGHQGGHNE